MQIIKDLHHRKTHGRKSLAVLIDPEDSSRTELIQLLALAEECSVDYLLVGGSTATHQQLVIALDLIEEHSNLPTLIFPGNNSQIHNSADAILFLSLISGRNPEFLIEQQVKSVAKLRNTDLEIIPTGYILIGDNTTSVAQVSKTDPIPQQEKDKIVDTALAGQYLGMQLIYLEAGSGAKQPIHPSTIFSVKAALDIPLIVGGGIRNAEAAQAALNAGADLIVIGNILEKDPSKLIQISKTVHNHNQITI